MDVSQATEALVLSCQHEVQALEGKLQKVEGRSEEMEQVVEWVGWRDVIRYEWHLITWVGDLGGGTGQQGCRVRCQKVFSGSWRDDWVRIKGWMWGILFRS